MFRVFRALRKYGPLGTAWNACIIMEKLFGCTSNCRCPFSLARRALWSFHVYLDGRFDRTYGTDTSGVISLDDLTIESQNIKDSHWYAPMSVKVFGQIMDSLAIDFQQFDFVDFGSGKGRILLFASQYGFKRTIGIEFALELHSIATKNVTIWESRSQKPSRIETVFMDAVQFPIPSEPLFLFFYSPFKGSVMQRVLDNILSSLTMSPRDFVLVFYGSNPESIRLLEATGFPCRELKLRVDWSRFTHYRGLLFANAKCEK